MTTRSRHRLHPALHALATFCLVSAVLLSIAGGYLATHLNTGPYIFTVYRPGQNHSQTTIGTSGHHLFVRSAGGAARFGRPIDDPNWPLPPGTILGSMAFEVREVCTGFPKPTRREWTIALSDIEPTADGPPASDTRAWLIVLTQSLDPDLREYPLIREGEAAGSSWSLWNFCYNAAWRLLHAPTWLGPCLLLAALSAALVYRRSGPGWRRHRGQCSQCGYDLRGLPASTTAPLACPECGAVATAPLAASSC